MGSCGCASEDLLFRFPGPEGITYALEVYDSCHYCSTPAGVVLYRIDPNGKYPDIGEQLIEDVPEVEFKGDFCVTQVAIPVVDPDELFAALCTLMGVEEHVDYAEGMFDRQAVAYVLPQVVRTSLDPFYERRRAEAADG